MKGLDTNILVYASDSTSVQYPVASRILKELAEGSSPWALPWPCIYEYLRVVTHPRVTRTPLAVLDAWRNIETLMESPSLLLLSQTDRHQKVLKSVVQRAPVSGNLVHDAHIAALLIEHGVQEIVTADEDFRRFEDLTVINPFV